MLESKLLNMKFVTCVVVILFSVFVNLSDEATGFEDLRRQLMQNPQLRRELIEGFAKVTGKSILSDKIDVRGTILSALQNGRNYRPFGIEFTLPETIQLLILMFREAPRPESIVLNRYFKSNGDLNVFITGLRVLKKILTRRPTIDENDSSLIVDTTEGKVRGVRMDENGVKYIGFFNIPYASLPKRFMAPKPPKPWKGIRNAMTEERFCPQRLMVIDQIAGVEDCLQLNIHLPTPRARGRPVFVWVHGGGFNFGVGSTYFFKPDKLLKQGLIVVSFHYRLGALGFLSTGTKDAPGNAGMKDMVAALKWIKSNAENFGGDPNSITLYGVSSGAIAIEYLILSPMARGLFSRGIMSSGSVFNEWAYATDPLKFAFRLGRELGSNATHVKDLLRFLRRVNPLQIVEAQEKLAIGNDPSNEFIPFVPCTESNVPGEEPFLNNHPEDIMRSGQYNQVPLIITFNDQEGLQILNKVRSNPNYVFSIDRNLEYYLPRDILSGLDKLSEKQDILNRIRKFYFNGRSVSNRTVQATVDLLSDTKFLLGVYKSVKLRTATSNMPTFYGQFAYDGDLSTFKYYNDVGVRGVAHADDIGYVFSLPFEKVYTDNNATSQLVALRYITIISNFAKYGHPIPKPTNLLPVNWYPIQSTDTYDYLRITDKLEMKQNPFQKRYAFWENLYMYKYYLLYKNGRHYNNY